ncbi:unnamed protein product [Rotaria socialis]|uniref:Uncharacterized protein n=1 Tax=Rotaria socialis TaxID=392032 RepID=A0A820XTZ1_9BILA|nr:unnamed protein product [Rotaria socialis]
MDKVDVNDGVFSALEAGVPWTTPLSGCFDDVDTCVYGLWCLPCLFGQNAKQIDGTDCTTMCCLYSLLGCLGMCWIPHVLKRKILRQKYSLREEPCEDSFATCCCGPCAVCQETRELKARGMQLITDYLVAFILSLLILAGSTWIPRVAPVRQQPVVAYRR